MSVRLQIAAIIFMMVQGVFFGVGVVIVLATSLKAFAAQLMLSGHRHERSSVSAHSVDDRATHEIRSPETTERPDLSLIATLSGFSAPAPTLNVSHWGDRVEAGNFATGLVDPSAAPIVAAVTMMGGTGIDDG